MPAWASSMVGRHHELGDRLERVALNRESGPGNFKEFSIQCAQCPADCTRCSGCPYRAGHPALLKHEIHQRHVAAGTRTRLKQQNS